MPEEHKKYEPIENYGIIGNLQTVALVSNKASIDFMCFPRFDSPTIFGALMDAERGGKFSIKPRMNDVVHRQLYLPDTAIIITRFFSSEGIAEVTDFMPINELDERGTIVRRVTSIRGKLTFDMECSPRFNYATHIAKVSPINEKRIDFADGNEDEIITLQSTININADNTGFATSVFQLEQSQVEWFVLTSSKEETVTADHLKHKCIKNYQMTINFWQNWIEQSTYRGRWRELVNRSAITLKLLTSHKYGSVVAAPTFSLPEVVGGARNWDYRFSWIRDSSFTMYAFLRLGFYKEAEAFLKWIQKQCAKGKLQLMYSIDGKTELTEKSLPHLEGYKQSSPVRIGNAAHHQFQLDVYGELLDTIYLFDKNVCPITYEFWKEIERQVDFVQENWQQPDHGIWEIRNEKREFLHSRLMTWVAMDRAIKIAEARSFPFPETEWKKTRDAIFKSIYNDFWNEDIKSYVQYKGGAAVDASVLLMPLMRFVSSDEPRWLETLKTIDERLRLDVLIYRYNNQLERIDGLEGDEGTFNMCSFWYIECLAKAGQVERARENFEKMIGYSNHLGLFSEEIGARGEHLGNFPQAFTHLALISAALQLDKNLSPM